MQKIVKNNILKEKNKIERYSNIEFLRIVSMLLIVAHHYVVNSKLLKTGSPVLEANFSAKLIFLFVFGAWGKIAINCFVMITGYFMCPSQITAKKLAKLVCEFMFYR